MRAGTQRWRAARAAIFGAALVALLGVGFGRGAPAVARGGACVLRAEVAGVINPGSADYLASAVERAGRERCEALVVVLDTPGGMLESTREIVRTFLTASVPVVVYVAPTGARAGSAGAFITLAAHVAVMAPGATIGAAHPVVGLGKDPEEAGGEHMGKKVENDAAAFARSIAEQRGRNVEWAERAVRESVAATASEALELGVVDRIAESEAALLAALDGLVVALDGAERTLATAGAAVVTVAPTVQQRVLQVLGSPDLAYGLLMLGLLGVMVEVKAPGLFVPGGVGLLCLLLAAIGLNVLPVNLGGIALLVVAVALLVAELYVGAYGLLALGALGCLLLGSALLIDETDPRFFADSTLDVSWGAVIPLAALLVGATLALAWLLARAHRGKSPAGAEGIVGETGVTRGEVGPDHGHVSVHGEQWSARAEIPIPDGAPVEVVAIEGLELQVRAIEGAHHEDTNQEDARASEETGT